MNLNGAASAPYAFKLEPSFVNMEPMDELVKEVANWIAEVAQGRSDIEIEAKFGVVVDKNSNMRLRLPVASETILDPREAYSTRFESKLSVKQHERLNRMLNERTSATKAPDYPNAVMSAVHLQTIDEFYPIGGESEKLRLTRDEKTGEVKECLVKKRLGDLHILCPKQKVDWRISVNIESPADIPATGRPSHSRRKNRMEYIHQHFKIDLTQVQPSDSNTPVHELEVEFAFPEQVRRVLELRYKEGPETFGFDQLVAVFVNNCRILARTIKDE